MQTVSIVLPCYNEEENILPLYEALTKESAQLTRYHFEFIFIDNHSTDKTVDLIKGLIDHDKRVKLIVNARNFGHIRSPFYGMMQACGDAVILMASDLQDPPSLIPQFIAEWEKGSKAVVGVKPVSQENKLMFWLRKTYYKVVGKLSDTPLLQNFTGFGLYDRRLMDVLRTIEDPYPYFRGLIVEIGFDIKVIEFDQPRRLRGITKNNFYTLYDMAMLGVTSHTKVPLRLATMGGFFLSILSMGLAIVYLALKLIFWSHFSVGIAPILIGLFFFSSVQLFFIGLLGEYLTAVHTQIMKRPRVVEQERVNFES